MSGSNRRPAGRRFDPDIAGCPNVMTWHSVCIRVVHGMCRLPKVFTASAHENSSYLQSRSCGNLQRPTALRLNDYDRAMYISRGRQQFRLRIQQTEVILASILDNVHRLNIRMRHLASVNICLTL